MPSSRQQLNSEVMATPELKSDVKTSVQENDWDDTFMPESPPPSPMPDFNESCNGMGYDELELDSDSISDYYSIVESEIETPNSSGPKCGICATIFQKSAAIPITIIVTSPDKEIPNPVETPESQRNASRFPFPSPTSNLAATNNIDHRLLTPPAEKHLDPRRTHKAFEAPEIRKWLISFLNSKGDQFPRNIRDRMMDLYGIRERDLAPEIVERFHAEMQDEGVAMAPEGQLGAAESLRVLGAAFRSQIAEATPKRPKGLPLPGPRRHGIPPRRPELKKPEHRKERHLAESSMVRPRAGPLNSRPLNSRAGSSRDALRSDQQYLKRGDSAPNLHNSPPRPVFNSTQSSPSVRPCRNTRIEEEANGKQLDILQPQARIKRKSILSSAFGAVKGTFNRRAAKGEQTTRVWDGSLP